MRAALVLAALTLAACGREPPAPVAVSDLCARIKRPGLANLCPWATLPALAPTGFPTCSTVTEEDAREIGANSAAWEEQCLKP